jgi:hypothetical protein
LAALDLEDVMGRVLVVAGFPAWIGPKKVEAWPPVLFVIGSLRTAGTSQLTNIVPMEGSMRTMSWSRYHYLCWSFRRIRMRLRYKRTAIRRK